MALIGNFTKQPVEVKDYDIDYSQWLTGTDTIENVAVTVAPAGLTVDSVFFTGTSAKVWLSGGTSGTTYKLEATATTADGRVQQDEFKVKVKEA